MGEMKIHSGKFYSSKKYVKPVNTSSQTWWAVCLYKGKEFYHHHHHFVYVITLCKHNLYITSSALWSYNGHTHTLSHKHTHQSDNSHTHTDLVRQPGSAEQVKWHIGGDGRVKEETSSSEWSWEISSSVSGQHSSSAASSFSARSNLAAYGSSISCGQTGRERRAATVIYFSLGLAALCRCHSLSVCLRHDLSDTLPHSTSHSQSPAWVYSTKISWPPILLLILMIKVESLIWLKSLAANSTEN